MKNNFIIIHISECSKLLQKWYKSRYEWEEKVIHWKLRKI